MPQAPPKIGLLERALNLLRRVGMRSGETAPAASGSAPVVEPLPQEDRPSARLRWGLLVGANALYTAAILLVDDDVVTRFIPLTTVPVILAGYFFGARGGVVMGVASYPLNAALVLHIGLGWAYVFGQLLPGTLIGMAVGYVVGTMQELRQRLRRNQHALLERQRLLDAELLLAGLPAFAYLKDSAGRYIAANPQFCKALGRSLGEIVGCTDHDLYSPAQAEAYLAAERRLLDEGAEALEVEEIFVDGGRPLDVATRVVRLRDALGEPVGIAGLRFDITERKRAQENLRLSEVRYRSLVEGSAQGLLIHRDGKVLFANAQLAQMLGYEGPQELLDLETADRLIDPMDRNHALQPTRVASGGDGADGVTPSAAVPPRAVRGARKDGGITWLEVTSTAIDWDGSPAAQSTLIDVTLRRQAEENLRQAQKLDAVGQLAGGIAHDFNNLLQVMQGYLGVVMADIEESDPKHEMLRSVFSSTEKAASLSRRMLAFAREDTPKFEIIDLNQITNDLADMLRRIVREDITLIVETQAPSGKVRGDAGMLEQVLINLAVNARDAMEPDTQGGTLTISTRRFVADANFCAAHGMAQPGPAIEISIADTGCGMTAAVQERIFEPFFTTKEPGKGTGLGLAMVYGIVQQHGGVVGVESEPGQGATFRITLPLARGAAAATVPEAVQALPGGSECILIAEDDDTVRELTRRLLEAKGYQVLEARDGDQALQVFLDNRDTVQLAIVDGIMPGMGGGELQKAMRREVPGLPVLLASGYADRAKLPPGLDGMRRLTKPFTIAQLLSAVREELDAARPA